MIQSFNMRTIKIRWNNDESFENFQREIFILCWMKENLMKSKTVLIDYKKDEENFEKNAYLKNQGAIWRMKRNQLGMNSKLLK